MRPEELNGIAAALDREIVAERTLAGGFSHETSLLTLEDGLVVARLGGPDPYVEAAIMDAARRHVPVPRVLHVADDGDRPVMVLEHVDGTPLSQVLGQDGLGAEVGRVVAGIGAVTFDRPGFFADDKPSVSVEPPWSRQLPEVAAACMRNADRLDTAARRAWVELCVAHAPALEAVDDHARLVHADLNPKNILVEGARVVAVLDWEFAYSGCPYGDPANMLRFGADYPEEFRDGFRTAWADNRPEGLPRDDEWVYLGRVLDMFALSDLLTRPEGHPVADRAADEVRRWVAAGVPR